MKRLHGIIVGRREAVFRCEAVLEGDDDDVEVVGHVEAESVEYGGGCMEEKEAATMKEKD